MALFFCDLRFNEHKKQHFALLEVLEVLQKFSQVSFTLSQLLHIAMALLA